LLVRRLRDAAACVWVQDLIEENGREGVERSPSTLYEQDDRSQDSLD
jgi:hypothetical protein